MLEALKFEAAGISVNGVLINNVRYADDTVIIFDSLENLKKEMSKILSKTKFMQQQQHQRNGDRDRINKDK